MIIPTSYCLASENIKARIGNNYYDTLEEAIKNASNTDNIILTANTKLNQTLEINKTININLNGNTIEAEEQVFLVEGGSLNLTGNGIIKETNPNYGAIMIKGSEDETKENYSTVNIGENVTLEGWSGIFITHNNNKSYGVLATIKGTINALNDKTGGPGIGIYVNGNIKHESNAPIINLTNTAKIKSTGNGIYSAGFAIYNINGAYIEGSESALGIKSGIFNIKNGTLIGTGEDKTPTNSNNNGINASGAAIQIESNPNYQGNIELTIENGKIESKKSYPIYEYTVNNSETKVKKINISGGNYISYSNKPNFSVSNSFKNKHQNFISGGTYTSNPKEYVKNSYQVTKNNNIYEVQHVFKENIEKNISNNKKKNNIVLTTTLIISSLIFITSIIFINKKKIFIIF